MSILKELSFFGKNYSILVVEDDKELNNELMEVCQLFFKSVDFAYDGQEALEKYKNNHFNYDIVLSDITMPKMNGVVLSREIKSLKRNQDILILSAHNEMNYLIDLIDIGISQFVTKPFEQNELLFRLLKICENLFYKNEYIRIIINESLDNKLSLSLEV
jgi:DNA-binding response OmpR family regulator